MAFARFQHVLVALLLIFSWAVPASAQVGPPRAVHIRVYVFNTRTSSAVPSVIVYFEQARTASCPTGAGAYGTTGTEGVADIYANACAGSGEIFSYGNDTLGLGSVRTGVLAGRNQQFDGGAVYVTIVAGEPSYLVRLPLTPTENNEGHSSELRTLHIRVRGLGADGKLVAVHFATVYDAQGNHVATTDYNGMATATVRAPLGETVRMSADGGAKWGEGSSSFIAGASEGGTRLTRADDYINFVLRGTGRETTEEVELSFTIQGQGKNGLVPVHNASVYDNEGRHLVTTDYGGHAHVTVKVPVGETYIVKVDAGSRWKPASKEIIGGPRGSSGAVPYNLSGSRSVAFVLEPSVAAKELTVEVLNHDTGKPVPSATVTIYKPDHFPGTAVAHATTDAHGLATFDAEEVASAVLNGEARVGAAHGGSKSAVQTLSVSLLSGETPHYLLYLRETEVKTNWSGTWYNGPYTMQVSGGAGSLGYQFLRSDGAGTCCPLIDQGGGSCTVHGNVATCTENAHYHDSGKDVQRSSTVTLTLSGQTISTVGKIKTASITLSSGQPCPDIAQCTGLHPGAEFSGTWTRKKP
ncbi:MAG TPA: hypothetical protein VFO29_12065 [Candidatus Rubrimentiphilum sp.]|nr:hypothetical protein [Candidatus Rubrimentiphilum sp.]